MVQVIQTLCDIHDLEEQKVDADAGTVPIKYGRREIEVDLCGECLTRFETGLDLLFKVGRKPGRSTPQRRPTAAAPAQSVGDGGGGGQSKGSYVRDAANSPDGTFVCRFDGDCERKVSTPEQPGFKTAQGRGMYEYRAHDLTKKNFSPKAAVDS